VVAFGQARLQRRTEPDVAGQPNPVWTWATAAETGPSSTMTIWSAGRVWMRRLAIASLSQSARSAA
jgi:hypothetical protein